MVAQALEIDGSVIVGEFDVTKMIKAAKPARPFSTPPRFPAIDIDVALIVDGEMAAQQLEQRIRSLGKKTPLEDVRLFDVYTGKGIEPGKKSLAFTLSYRAIDRTLTTEEIEKAHTKIIEGLEKQVGAFVRS